jgi:integrase
MADVRKAGDRAALKVDPDKIVWTTYMTGRAIGYRRTSAGGGTWWARWRDPDTGKQHYKNLGALDDLPAHAQWDAAVTAASAFFTARSAGIGITIDASSKVQTVRDACDRYIKHVRSEQGEKKAAEAEARFRRLVYVDPIARVELAKLRQEHFKQYRERLRATPAKVTRRKGDTNEFRPRADSTFNRDLVPLRAALNLLIDDGLIGSDAAWRKYLRPVKNADGRRGDYLDLDDRRRLIEKATDEIKPFVRGLALLPLRPGALAGLMVGDYDPRIKSLRIGKDKDDRDRWITVPENVATLLKDQSRGKLPAAPLFCRGNGLPWNKETWKGPIKDAAKAADLPAATTAYVLRHSTITDLVVNGLDLLTVATISGTSVQMIQRHYGHLQRDHAAAALARLAL